MLVDRRVSTIQWAWWNSSWISWTCCFSMFFSLPWVSNSSLLPTIPQQIKVIVDCQIHEENCLSNHRRTHMWAVIKTLFGCSILWITLPTYIYMRRESQRYSACIWLKATGQVVTDMRTEHFKGSLIWGRFPGKQSPHLAAAKLNLVADTWDQTWSLR